MNDGNDLGGDYKRRRIPGAVVDRVMQRDSFKCKYCGATSQLEIDHVIPLIAGGSDLPINLVVACRACNASKSDDLLPREWWLEIARRGIEEHRAEAEADLVSTAAARALEDAIYKAVDTAIDDFTASGMFTPEERADFASTIDASCLGNGLGLYESARMHMKAKLLGVSVGQIYGEYWDAYNR